jgi:signal transduction histidine kinase
LEVQVSALRDPVSAGGTAPRVLLVEDDPDVRAARRMLLESEGYRVEAVASLEQALEAARRAGSFDAIVTDDPLPIEPLAALLGRPLKGVLVTDDPPRTGNALLRSDVTMRVTRGALRAEDLLLPLRELIGERTGPAASVGGGDAAALIVHELRSSLAVISNVLETCRTEALSARLPNAREILGRQIRKIARMADDLLEAQESSRVQRLQRCEPVSLARVIVEVVQDLGPQIRRRDQSLVLELPHDALRVGGDAVRLGQVVTNIVENASKYSGAGDRISISLRRTGRFAEMRVRDCGIGIRSEDLPHIFTPRFRCRGPQSSAREGSGLGLALARRLIELHGGTIEARSAGPGEGSEFTVRLAALPESAIPGYVENPDGGSTGRPDSPSTQST